MGALKTRLRHRLREWLGVTDLEQDLAALVADVVARDLRLRSVMTKDYVALSQELIAMKATTTAFEQKIATTTTTNETPDFDPVLGAL